MYQMYLSKIALQLAQKKSIYHASLKKTKEELSSLRCALLSRNMEHPNCSKSGGATVSALELRLKGAIPRGFRPLAGERKPDPRRTVPRSGHRPPPLHLQQAHFGLNGALRDDFG